MSWILLICGGNSQIRWTLYQILAHERLLTFFRNTKPREPRQKPEGSGNGSSASFGGEVTFGNGDEALARLVGHLTPRLLEVALTAFEDRHGFLPKVIVTHLSPPWEEEIRRELEPVASKLGVELNVSWAGMEVEI